MNLQEELEALKQRIAELEYHAKEEQEFPRDGDRYWYMTTTGKIFTSNWDGFDFDFDEAVLEIGNIFQTKEQAEFAVEKLRVEAELRKFSRPFEEGENNYFVVFESLEKTIALDCDRYLQTQGTIYFETAKVVLSAVDTIGADRIKKYIFGVE